MGLFRELLTAFCTSGRARSHAVNGTDILVDTTQRAALTSFECKARLTKTTTGVDEMNAKIEVLKGNSKLQLSSVLNSKSDT